MSNDRRKPGPRSRKPPIGERFTTRKPTTPGGPRRQGDRQAARTSWDSLAGWYDGWVGPDGSYFHQEVVVPAALDLLQPQTGEQILDIGAGQGVLAPRINRAGAHYTGVDASPRLLKIAEQRHGTDGRFLLGDAANLAGVRELQAASFDAATFILSVQDMDPLEKVISSAAWALKPGGRLVLLMTHPAFRIPRQSGWGWDAGRKLQYRRIDSYMSQLAVPLKPLPGQPATTTRSFHRPLSVYVNTLADAGLLIERMSEIPSHKTAGPSKEAAQSDDPKAAERARLEIPLFLGLRARKLT